jgi:hypothetical protein
MVLIGISAVVIGTIILLPLILTVTLPDLSKLSITIDKIEFEGIEEKNNTAILNVSLNVTNPTTQALTTSKIDYRIFANGESLGDYTNSYADIPINGRPQFLANRDSILQHEINVPLVEQRFVTDLNNNNKTLQNIDWEVQGSAIIESGFSSTIKNFTASW